MDTEDVVDMAIITSPIIEGTGPTIGTHSNNNSVGIGVYYDKEFIN